MPSPTFITAAFAFLLTATTAFAQTNTAAAAGPAMTGTNPAPGQFQSPTNQIVVSEQRFEQVRADCIQNRRIICGKILKILPDGLVVDSGYTNLMRYPLNRSWLIPGTATANKAIHFVEEARPDSVCVGLVFLTDAPKSRRLKPNLYDYVLISGYPTGRYTYTSLGTVQRTVRRYSAVLSKAVAWNLQGESKP